MRKESAITMISLVVTIIVLIILAGISFSATIGENGIITKAKQAKQNIILAGEAEAMQLNQLYYELETGGKMSEDEESTKKDEIIALLQKQVEELKKQVISLQTENAELKKQIEDLNVQISNLQKEIADLKAQIASKDIEIAALKKQVSEKEAKIQELQNQLNNLNSLLAQTNATADKILAGYKAYSGGKLITGTMANRGTVSSNLNCGQTYTIPAGYHNGLGKVTASSLASQTQATATADNLSKGVTAWVNGVKLIGNGKDIENSYENEKVYLYKAGNPYTDITGGWKSFVNYGTGGTVKFESNKIILAGNTGGNNQIAISTNQKINKSGYNYFCVKTLTGKGFNMGSCPNNSGNNILPVGYYYTSVSGGNDNGIVLKCPLKSDSYIVINVLSQTIEIEAIWLEK